MQSTTAVASLRSANVLLVAAFIAVNIADALTTWVAVGRGHVEGNPFMAALMGSTGVEATMLMKFAVAAAVAGLLLRRDRAKLLIVPTVLLGLIAVNNAVVIALG
ncbi:MAG: hypothetical protein FJ318_10010 [SAR202 cluster bacterium]|nr:hypothetical protein [SAR202 cluster bacterium]